jgi:hypothetical protein
MTTKKARDLAYGDLFDLAELPQFSEVDSQTRRVAAHSYVRTQTESWYEGAWFWLDTSLGFFRVDPDLEVVVARNEPHPFGSRSK